MRVRRKGGWNTAANHRVKEIQITDSQRGRLKRPQFVYGDHGPKATPGNHTFIQGFLEHARNVRNLRGWKSTPERVEVIGSVLAAE